MIRWKIAQWFELRWWKSYLCGKNKEEYLEWKRNYWQNVLEKISGEIKIDSSKTICDLGCGPAGIFTALPNNEVIAIDPLLLNYEKHIPFFSKKDYPSTTFIQNTIEDFDCKRKFDLVFCMNAINHVHDIEKGFDKLRDICAFEGTIILSIDAHNYYFFKHLLRLIPGDILHPHQYDLEEYKSFIKKRGFRILKTELLKAGSLFSHHLIIAK